MSHSPPLAATMTLGEAFDASEAIPPVPLAKEIRRAGMLYSQIFRQGDVAIYCAKVKGPRIEYEVFQIQILPAEKLGGRGYPVRESFPKNSDWGSLGFTYTNNSHRDPLADAQLNAREQEATRV
jgi:hypothetical protein